MRYMEAIKKWLGELTEVALLLVALGIVIQILFGGSEQVPFVGAITTNLMNIISSLGDKGLVGLIALAVIIYLFRKRTTA